jgi:tRNA(Ile)-lysidine synthase
MALDPKLVERFSACLSTLTGDAGAVLGLAVSGGPDSLALLLLAAAASPGRIEAATVDHGLRPEGADEARAVAAACAQLNIPHVVLEPGWTQAPTSNVQAGAREARYAALGRWAGERGLAFVATAHHTDDQAETLLLRLARGAGLSGLAGVRPVRAMAEGPAIVRPLLGWHKAELVELVARAGLVPADDPSNRDQRYDRTRARALLAATDWLDPARLAAAAANLADAEAALSWCASRLWEKRASEGSKGEIVIDPTGLPRELRRRLLLAALTRVGVCANELPGPKLMRLLGELEAGRSATLGGALVRPGPSGWTTSRAPPRRG